MDYRQRSEESVDDFVTRARTQALKCEFEESELEERIIELMIASTPIEAFQRELLGKAKSYKLTDALAEGRRFEAILVGLQEIQKRTSTPLNNVGQAGMWQLWPSPSPKSMSHIQHTTSSPRFPQYNGFTERQVQTIKKIIKCKKEKQPRPCHSQPSSNPSRLQAAITSRDADGQAYHHIASFPHLSISRHCCTTSTFGSQTVDDEVQL